MNSYAALEVLSINMSSWQLLW